MQKTREETNIEITNKAIEQGHFQIKKTNREGNEVLEGAEFQLANLNGEIIKTVISDNNGIAKFDGLPIGEYKLKEINAPEGYKVSDKTWNVSVTSNGTNVKEFVKGNQETIINTSTSNAQFQRQYKTYNEIPLINFYTSIKKYENTGKTYFYIDYTRLYDYDFNKELYIEFNTDDFDIIDDDVVNGVFRDNLNAWSRYVDGNYWFEIKLKNKDFEGNERTIYPIKTFKYAGVDIGDFNKYIASVTQTKNIVGEPDKEVPIELTPNSNEFTVKNEKIPTQNFKLKKTNEDGSQVLSGAEFTLKEADENWQDIGGENSIVGTTGEDGYVYFDDLPVGNYLLKETKAPNGYEAFSDYIWKIKVDEEKITVINDREYEIYYEIYNPDKSKRLYYGGDNPLIDFSTLIEPIKDTNSYKLKINYIGQEDYIYMGRRYYYGEDYILSIEFDTENFDITEAPNGFASKTISSGKYYYFNGYNYENSGTITYIVTPKKEATAYGSDISPIKSLSYANRNFGVIEPSYYAGLKTIPNLNTNELVLEKTDDFFEYSTINKKRLGSADFYKVEEYEDDKDPEIFLSDAVFEVEKKNEDSTYTKLNRVFVSDENGKIHIDKLEAGEYRLIEKSPPTGYRPNLGISKEFKIYIDKDNNPQVQVKDKNGNYVSNEGDLQYIENIKLGEFEYSFIKKDAKTNEPINGVVFEIRNSDGVPVGVKRTSGVPSKPGEEPVPGKVTFTELTPGKYWIYEITQQDGYIKESKPIEILVGEQYDVPKDSNGDPIKGDDISKYFSLDPLKPSSLVSTSDNEEYVYPNEAEGLRMDLHYLIDESIQVRPGDTFTLKLSDNVDVDGIGYTGDRGFDIYGPMGRLAVAKVRDDRKTIDYTFTEAIQEGDKITNLSINLPMFIDRYVIPNNENNVSITAKIGDGTNAIYTDKISVSYDAPNNYGYINNRENVKNYIIKFNPETGEFTSVIYLNPWRAVDENREFFFGTNIPSTVTSVKIYRTTANSPSLPWSFAIDYKDINNPYRLQHIKTDTGNIYVDMYYPLHYNFSNDYGRDQYVIEIKGKVSEQGEFETSTVYYRDSNYVKGYLYNDIYRGYDEWHTYVAYYQPGGEASGTERTLYNQKNRIEYIKMSGKLVSNTNESDTDGNIQNEEKNNNLIPDQVLEGAEFELRKKNEKGEFIKIDGLNRTSGEDGKFFWEGLSSGEYEVWEIKAPEGYLKPSEAVSSFTVNENGEIVNIKDNTTIVINIKPEYPHTGGIGTLIFTILGVGLMTLAFIGYKRKKVIDE